MQQVKLPLKLDPVRSAQKRLGYEGIYSGVLLKRVMESVVSINNDVEASFHFSVDAQQLVVITGKAQIMVNLVCQRCGEVFEHTVNITYCYSPVSNDQQAKDLPDSYDSIELNEYGEIDLLSIIEDEFILALPAVSMHTPEICGVLESYQTFGDLPEEAEKPNPFTILASLKK